MLKDLAEPRRVVTLIPNTGIQFLDFGFNEADIQNVARNFWEEVSRSEVDEDGKPKRTLYPLEQDQEGRLVYLSDANAPPRMAPEDETYGVRAQRALDILDGAWLPLPYLRQKERSSTGRRIYDEGPTNWARIRVAKLEIPDKQGNTHRVTIAIDTLLLERRANAPYAAPETSDALEDIQFKLVTNNLDNRFYLALNWVRDWLRECYLGGLTGLQGRHVRLEDLQYPTEYWANYIMLLEGITEGCQIPVIQFADTLSALKGKPVEVNLVLDIGNSRTCGILIEQPANQRFVEISQAYRLELRDLTHAERTYDYPFESRIEFAPASFGSSEHSRKSGRPKRDAFWWPSPVRVGPEASWLSAQSDGTEGITGLSSPKRYLWDKDAQPQPWSNNRGTLPHDQAIPSIKGPMTARLTEAGDLIRAGDGAMVGLLPRYSRSSLYTLMLSELLIHAITQINSVAIRYQRADRDLPRILKRIILTLPSATPVAEQKILRRRAQAAIDLVWQVMDWQVDDPVHPKPAIKLDWDEATCTHLVYLYNEINRKYRGLPRDFFSLMRKKRNGDETLSLRIASMDMGGGTTDLMIVQHEIEGQAIIHPRQLFREGFRQAGDDILKVVVEDCVLPCVRRALEDSGVSSAERIISDLFSGDVEGMGQQQRVKRALFVNQVLVPIALGLLGHYEKVDSRRPVPPRHFKMEELLGSELTPSEAILGYLEEVAKRDGGEDFSLKAVNFTMDADQMAGAVLASGAKGVIEDLCDVVRSYDCDLLLLSGRPSRLPAIHDLIISNLAVTPNRVVPMDTYEVGNWYPFRGSDFRIQDPKTTVVVGAMLCHICEGLQEGFNMRASEIRMRSTARYVGVMNINDQILDENVLLENVDLDTGQGLVQFDVHMEKPFFIGYRQLPLERWKTTPLYHVEFRNPERVPNLKLPLTVTFERATPRNEDDEEVMEDFRISDAMDAERAPCRNEVQVRLQTMRVNSHSGGGYWLDTGILRTGGRL